MPAMNSTPFLFTLKALWPDDMDDHYIDGLNHFFHKEIPTIKKIRGIIRTPWKINLDIAKFNDLAALQNALGEMYQLINDDIDRICAHSMNNIWKKLSDILDDTIADTVEMRKYKKLYNVLTAIQNPSNRERRNQISRCNEHFHTIFHKHIGDKAKRKRAEAPDKEHEQEHGEVKRQRLAT